MSRGGLEKNIQTEMAIGQFQKHTNNNKYKKNCDDTTTSTNWEKNLPDTL